MMLTRRQEQVLKFIKDFILQNSYPPTLREIAKGLKLSPSTVNDHLHALKRKKVLNFSPYCSRTLIPSFSLPILGEIKAGHPVWAEENILGYFNLFKEFAANDIFLLKVSGDSMKDAGILEGDIVVVKKNVKFSCGDIVVALVSNEFTIKRLSKEGEVFWLLPENPSYQKIKIDENVQIMGKVIGVIRKYV